MNNQHKGFTLIEIMIVVTILGIIAATVLYLVDPGNIIESARDMIRKNDISRINDAILAYQTINNDYPKATIVNTTVTDDVTGESIPLGRDRTDESIPNFLKTLKDSQFLKYSPQDPLNPEVYPNRYSYYYNADVSPDTPGYVRWHKGHYVVYAYLQNVHDKDCLKWRNNDGTYTTTIVNAGTSDERCVYIFDSGNLVRVSNEPH